MPDPNAKRDTELNNISGALKNIHKVLDAMNTNLVAAVRLMQEPPAETSQVPKPPYTTKHLPYLDTLHDDIGLGGWWQRSEARQIVQNTADEA